MADLQSALKEAFDKAEDGTLEAPVEREIEVDDEPLRNEKGQFASKESEEPAEEVTPEEAPSEETEVEATAQTEEEPIPETPKPTTWKKEYLPLWDKLDKGEALSADEAKKFLAYTTQRESEYKKGVSAYKAEADNARSLTEAIAPFVPELQQNGIHPAAWINNLGRAHMILSKAPYDQKMQIFQRLAQDYGIDLNLGQVNSGTDTTQYQDPQALALKQQIDQLNQRVQQVDSWREQEEKARLNSEISSFSADKPHFEALRETMAQLLESGQAQDLETAYDKAKWLVPEVREAEIKRMSQPAQSVQHVKKAKAAAVSVKSVTPSGSVTTGEKKDRRSLLEEKINSDLGNRV
jgi:hypothetical protein